MSLASSIKFIYYTVYTANPEDPKKLTPDAATLLSQLRDRRKKSKTDLGDLEAILEILES